MKALIKTPKTTEKTLQNKTILAIIAVLFVFSFGLANASVPTVSTDPADRISTTSATLNGSFTSETHPFSFWFEWGIGSTNTTSKKQTRWIEGTYNPSTRLTGLKPNTTYSYRLVAKNNDGTSYGDTLNFTTGDGESTTQTNTNTNTNTNNNVYYNNTSNNGGSTVFGRVPLVNTSYATNVTDIGVTLNGYVDPSGGTNVYRWFEWGTSQSLGNISGNLSVGTSPLYFSHGITGLERNTTYYFRAGARSNAGTVYGTIFSFTTGASQTTSSNVAPILMVKNPSYITTDSAQLNTTVIKGGSGLKSGYFEWGTSQALGNTTPAQALPQGASINMTALLTNLKPNTTYSFRAVVQDATSAVYRSQVVTFYTTGGTSGTGSTGTPGGSQTSNTGGNADTNKTNTKTGATTKGTAGAAGAFFARTSVALLGWFLSIILLVIVIVMAVMLKKSGKKEDTNTNEGFREFPDLPGHPITNTK